MKIFYALAAALLAGCAGTEYKVQGVTVSYEPYSESAPAAPKAAKLPEVDVPFTKHILPNGLTLVVHEDHSAPVVGVSIWYHVGSKNEKPGKTGFAHLFEHLMFNGSEHFKDEFFRPFEKVGATDMNGDTWLDRTRYYETVPTTALDLALWMESDRMGHLLDAIDQKTLDEQRGVVQNEKRQSVDNQPYGRVQEILQRASFPEGHPYRWETIGSMADLDAASLADVKEWFREYYGAANVTLVLAGDIDDKTAIDKATRYFGDIPSGPPVERREVWIAPRTESTREEMQDRVSQVRVLKSWNAPPDGSDDAILLDLATHVLGYGKSSRMYERLVYRDKIADSISVDLQAYELASMFNISADVKKGVDPAVVERAIGEELARLVKDGPTADELSRSQMDLYRDLVGVADRVGGNGKASLLAAGQVYRNDPAAYRDDMRKALAATPTAVRDAARRWLTQGDYTLTVKPFPAYTTVASEVDRKHGAPAVSQFPDLRFPALQRATLKNGMKVVFAERHDVPVVEFSMVINAGFAADQGRKLGTGAFSIAMLDEGSTHLNALQLSARQRELGAHIGSGSALDVYTVSLSALKARLKDSLALYADVVRNPAFDDAEFKRLQSQWLAGIEQEKTDADALALRIVPPLLYGEGHAYAIPFTGSGTEASVTSLTPADLSAFHRDWLRPDNATLLVAGDTNLKELVPMLDAAFGDWKAPDSPLPHKNVAAVAETPKPRVYLVDKPGAAQSQIIAGLLAPSSKAPNFIEIGTMNGVFGGSFTSRINMNLREDKHWSYGAGVQMPGALGQRPYLISAPVQSDKTVDSLREILRESREFVGGKPATADEIAKIKARNVRSLPGRYETIGSLIGALYDIVVFDRGDEYVQTLKSRIESQKDDDVRAAARQLIHPDHLTWVIVGDLAKIEQPIRKLNLGEVQVLDSDGKVIR
jgi:predicted Zn-dependent peptidase